MDWPGRRVMVDPRAGGGGMVEEPDEGVAANADVEAKDVWAVEPGGLVPAGVVLGDEGGEGEAVGGVGVALGGGVEEGVAGAGAVYRAENFGAWEGPLDVVNDGVLIHVRLIHAGLMHVRAV